MGRILMETLGVGCDVACQTPGVWLTLDAWGLQKWHKEGWIQILLWLEVAVRSF